MAASTDSSASSTDNTNAFAAPNTYTAGTYCYHRSWGYGRIREVSEATGHLSIDFKGKPGHSMAPDYAVQSLVLLPDSHIYAQKSEKAAALKEMAAKDPAALVTIVIHSLKAQATAENIQTALSPEVIPATEWKKWWEGAKRAMKKDGTYYIPTKKTEAFKVLSAPIQAGSDALAQFRAATGVEAQLLALGAVAKNWTEIADPAAAAEIATVVESTISKLPKSLLAKGIELALLRDELLVTAGQPPVTGPTALLNLVPTTPKGFAEILEKITGTRQIRFLTLIQAGRPDDWAALLLQILPFANGRMGDSVTTIFASVERHQEVVDALRRILRERAVTSDLLFWLCKNRDIVFASLFTPQLVMAILSVLEKDQFGDLKKGTKLYDLVHSDRELMATLLKGASSEDVRDITRAIILSPVFKELDKRSLLAIIIKLYPDMQELVVGDRMSSDDATLIVSWDSLQRRKAELEEVITKKIPENSKEIGIARSYGDLRENHEFKAAKEMQTVLMKRKAELESMIVRAQGTDFSGVETNLVNIGTIVDLVDIDKGDKLTYTILGAWDSDPAQGVISYLTALAQALIKLPVGEIVELQTEDGGKRKVRIEAIRNYKTK
ncbi:Transcription elongation factor, GreA/GreB family [Verrucomicrobium sp. GAS474]|uniref:GreA/GreB family elongation factor n=1 Tax=Verrucomicrobium sp. GAS474 TaxID=1882831 RepID=UPI00087D96E5|nr:GreA/GreB family elongation factor [Verrucomicrobium sp. GAS474]SDU19547.1 Transcription elongation factor, GreA/GreB family [Verrucomicrobium sp. GAS474]